jgi:hypothetical protein
LTAAIIHTLKRTLSLGTIGLKPWYILLEARQATERDEVLFELATFDHEEKLREIDEKRGETHEKP